MTTTEGAGGALSFALSFDVVGLLEVLGRDGVVLLNISPASTMFFQVFSLLHPKQFLCLPSAVGLSCSLLLSADIVYSFWVLAVEDRPPWFYMHSG